MLDDHNMVDNWGMVVLVLLMMLVVDIGIGGDRSFITLKVVVTKVIVVVMVSVTMIFR